MSKKFRAGRRKHQIVGPNTYSSKRRGGSTNIARKKRGLQNESEGYILKCSDCGATIIFPYIGADDVIRCFRCAVKRA